MKWPLALRSTVDNLGLCLAILREHILGVEARASQWHRELVAAERRLQQYIDKDTMSGENMAAIMSDWSDKRQAEFFNELGRITSKWPASGRCMQLCYASKYLDDGGREFIKELASYAGKE